MGVKKGGLHRFSAMSGVLASVLPKGVSALARTLTVWTCDSGISVLVMKESGVHYRRLYPDSRPDVSDPVPEGYRQRRRLAALAPKSMSIVPVLPDGSVFTSFCKSFLGFLYRSPPLARVWAQVCSIVGELCRLGMVQKR